MCGGLDSQGEERIFCHVEATQQQQRPPSASVPARTTRGFELAGSGRLGPSPTSTRASSPAPRTWASSTTSGSPCVRLSATATRLPATPAVSSPSKARPAPSSDRPVLSSGRLGSPVESSRHSATPRRGISRASDGRPTARALPSRPRPRPPRSPTRRRRRRWRRERREGGPGDPLRPSYRSRTRSTGAPVRSSLRRCPHGSRR